MKRSVVTLALLLALTLICSASLLPAYADSDAADIPVIGMMVFDYSNTHNSYIRTGVLNYVEMAGGDNGPVATIVMTDGQNDQSKQNDQLDTLLERDDIDIILQGMVDPGAAQTCLDKVAAKGLPMFFFNRAPDLEVLQTYDRCWYTGIPWRLPGEVEAQEVILDWKNESEKMDRNGDGVLQYVIIQGNLEQADAIHRTAANQDTLAEAEAAGEIKTELLAIDLGGFNTTVSKELMETWLVKYGDQIEAVLSNSDAMVIGACEALRADGYFTEEKPMYTYSINALPDALDLLRKGELRSTVLTDPWAQARALIDMSLIVLADPTVTDPTIGTEWTMGVDKDIRMNDETPIRVDNIAFAEDAFQNCLRVQ